VNWNYAITLPLFLVILGGILAGLLIGFVWEWFREHKQRAEAKAQRKERDQLAREVQNLRGEANRGKDEVLALLED
jgi:cell division protein FtsB